VRWRNKLTCEKACNCPISSARIWFTVHQPMFSSLRDPIMSTRTRGAADCPSLRQSPRCHIRGALSHPKSFLKHANPFSRFPSLSWPGPYADPVSMIERTEPCDQSILPDRPVNRLTKLMTCQRHLLPKVRRDDDDRIRSPTVSRCIHDLLFPLA
jgi:hypothetical protein